MSDQLRELFAQLMKDHCDVLLSDHTERPGICDAIRALTSADALNRSTKLAVNVAAEVLSTSTVDTGKTKEEAFQDFLLIATFFVTGRFPVVARSFPGGYLAWIKEACLRAEELPSCPALAHWLFVMDAPNVSTHLTITQKDKSQFIVYAWDFFNPSETKSLYGSDIRPDATRQQWVPRHGRESGSEVEK